MTKIFRMSYLGDVKLHRKKEESRVVLRQMRRRLMNPGPAQHALS